MIKNSFQTENGYTMTEILLVLSIFIIVVTISFVSYQSLIRQQQIYRFFAQLQLDVSYAQKYAITNYKNVYLRFYPENSRYEIISGFYEPSLLNRKFSDQIKLEMLTLPKTVTFYSNGTIERAGKMHVYYYDDIYQFVFLFGKGQTYVKKL
ncbi:competence type IV pilus minor pilin ComGD [Calidifontibacillus erzurumensis]|uniref:competence type IV pilus minor pilin ComGD n=1 Tax=Calidifontibacillus erzurumensis TaxID=2741433 RepID=UPI0035B53910